MVVNRLLFLAGLAGVILLLALALPTEAGPRYRDTIQVRVPARAAPDLAALSLTPRIAIDYEAFRWLHLTPADAERLTAAGIAQRRFPDAGTVRVPGYAFDPLNGGEPALPPALRAADGPGFRLVQFQGPIQDAWLDALAARGLRPLQYYPGFTYLVWDAAGRGAPDALDAVRWSGPFHPAYKLHPDLPTGDGPAVVTVIMYDDGALAESVRAAEALGATVQRVAPAQPDRVFYTARLSVTQDALIPLAQLPTVLWLGPAAPGPRPEDEVASQVVAGNFSGTTAVPGYRVHLDTLGVDGSGVTWAIVDTGVDYDHPDFNGRIVGGYTTPGTGCDAAAPDGDDCGVVKGHGTHVAGIALADAATGIVDSGGFLYGMGVAPAGNIFTINIFGDVDDPAYPPYQEFSRQALLGGAAGGNNSWTTGEGVQHGYQESERTHDIMVLDGNFDTATVAEPFIEVFSAGNAGIAGLTAPKEAKNLIVVAGSLNARFGSDPDLIAATSSRGPTVDARYGITVAAPGQLVSSTRNDLGGDCASPIAGTGGNYAFCSGTSMAAPHASGALVLATAWWRARTGGDPTPAMARALLVNSAVDMGAPDIPNFAEGWGRINITNLLRPGVSTLYYDEPLRLANSGDSWELTAHVFDGNRPVKITLTWSDAPGAVGANPALVNDLDLVVDHGGDTYLGNVFSGGWSAAGGTADVLNNIENVYIETPGSGTITLSVDAANVSGDAVLYNGDPTDQHFALICHNCFIPTATIYLPIIARP